MLCLLSLKHCLCMTIVNNTRYSTVISFQQSYWRMFKIYKGWLDSAKSLFHCKAQKSMYTRCQVLLQMRTYFYLIHINFIWVMRVLKQFCCQLEIFPTEHSYFCWSVMCYTMRPEVKTLFLLEQSRVCFGADISAIGPKQLTRAHVSVYNRSLNTTCTVTMLEICKTCVYLFVLHKQLTIFRNKF